MTRSMTSKGKRRRPKKKPARDRQWFERKVSELGEALERLPERRRKQFERDVLETGGSGKVQ